MIYKIERVGDFLQVDRGLNKFNGALEEYEGTVIRLDEITQVNFTITTLKEKRKAVLSIIKEDSQITFEETEQDVPVLREVYRTIKQILRDWRL